MKNYLAAARNEPYRFFFPLGILFLIWGSLLWLSQLWGAQHYPVEAHRYMMLNGFSGFFIAGFLMTAVPKFSKTHTARVYEIIFYFLITMLGLLFTYANLERYVFLTSALQAFSILFFLLVRILKRQENPPYSFLFIFVGLMLWIVSAIVCFINPMPEFKAIHYEGAIASIILGVGSRLIPGILGHVEIVQTQRKRYENDKPFILTVPLHFFLMIGAFIGSYFLLDTPGQFIRLIVVVLIAVFYWRLLRFPKEKTALTWCLWIACWFIVGSFILRALWFDGLIHASHAFFFSGIVLLSLLISTRVLQSHGPGKKELENLKRLYVVTFLVLLAGATRISAYLMPAHYLRHLGYSSVVLTIAVLIWSYRYLPFIFVTKGE